MTDQDRPAFAEAMFVLGATFSETVSDLRAEAYFSALSDLPLGVLQIAVASAVRSLRWFPKPVELRELALGSDESASDEAWAELLREVSRVGYVGSPRLTDARTGEVIERLWGSWQALCETLPAGGPELVGWRKQFAGVFRTVTQRHARAEQAQIAGGGSWAILNHATLPEWPQ